MSSTMGEIKSVKVDNWGVFFLQKLQNFFNKTDYCDLTLQFHDNSQLKVHRLVLSACTDYFNVLEQTCEVIDDALIMPNELQADVVVPIVNFMYTGTLEFELKMYGKLLRTAKEMNMTVLLKLLEAHRRTMEGVNRSQRPPSPKAIRRRGVTGTTTSPQFQTQPQRRILTASNTSPQRRIVQTKNTAPNSTQFRQQIGSTSLLRTTSSGTQNESNKNQQQSTSPFEQLRKGYNNTKRPASVTFETPPAKKPNIEDVKEFAEQQRMRKQIAAEYGDDQEYEGMLDDDIHNDDDDEDTTLPTSSSTSTATTSRSQSQQQPASATITFKHENDKPPTIVVKDTSNSKMNHAKIITEVLRQYPHLVKSNKNIKLKIVPSAGGQAHKIIVKKEQVDNAASAEVNNGQQQSQQKASGTAEKAAQVVAIKKPVQKVSTSTDTATTATATDSTSTQAVQKRRIDSKTMHALIALGAENTTGPWLCLRCGVNGRPISIPSYRSFRRHLINIHKQVIDAALCEYCGWRSKNHRELHYHMQVEHKIKSGLYTFPECLMCANIFLDNSVLNQHMIDSHPDENQQQCIYCNKIFAKEGQLYVHIKTYHKKQALEDGIIEFSDEEYLDDHHKLESKVKILSDISLPSAVPTKMEIDADQASTSGAEENTTTFINAEGEIITEPKFINADGNEVILTEEQRKDIMAQLNREHEGGVVMLLNENVFPVESSTNDLSASQNNSAEIIGRIDEIDETQNNISQPGAANDDDIDDSQIFSELASENAEAADKAVKIKKEASENLDESKESAENLEWAENLISSQESAEETTKTKPSETETKNQDDISKKLKELTGDWSDDDENENEEDEAAATDEHDDSFDPEFLVDKRPRQQKQNATKEDAVAEEEEEHNKSEEATVATVDPTAAKDPISDEPNIDEDDIELAMKSLHKEDSSCSEQKRDELQAIEDNTDATPTNVKTSETFDSVNDIDNSGEDKLVAGDTDNTVDDNANETEEESKEPTQSDIKTKKEEQIEAEETIADDANTLEDDKSNNVSKDLALSSDINMLDFGQLAETNADDVKDSVAEGEVEPEASIEDDVEAELKSMEQGDSTEKDLESESKGDEVGKEKLDAATKESEVTEEKVKSLMSEWGDDDDDGDEEL